MEKPLGLIQLGCRWIGVTLCLGLVLLLAGCQLPRRPAVDRLFLPLTLSEIDRVSWPRPGAEPSPIAGFTYDPQVDRYASLSIQGQIDTVDLTSLATPATPDVHEPHPPGITPQWAGAEANDPEAIAVQGLVWENARQVWVTGENSPGTQLLVGRFQIPAGRQETALRLPPSYGLLDDTNRETALPLPSFGGLTLSPDRERLFTLLSRPLPQDVPPEPDAASICRLLHYYLVTPEPTLVAEHGYPLDPELVATGQAQATGLLALDAAGRFLTLEVGGTPDYPQAKLFQVTTAGATDTLAVKSLAQRAPGVRLLRKRLVADLSPTANSVGLPHTLSWGADLADGSRRILVLSRSPDTDVETLLQFRLSREGTLAPT